jgi:hypothetical protein
MPRTRYILAIRLLGVIVVVIVIGFAAKTGSEAFLITTWKL